MSDATEQLTNPPRVVLLTGGTGLVGGAVAERLVAGGWTVRAAVRASSNTANLDALGVQTVVVDFDDEASLEAAAADASHVVHAAAKVGDWGDVQSYIDANVGGTRRLIAALPATIERFVHISSLGVYPARDHHGTDETAARGEAGIDGYTRSKIESEDVATQAATDGLPVIVLRPGFVYGPRDQAVIPRIIERVEDGKFAFLGSGDQLLNNVYVENLAEAVERALTCNYEEATAEGVVFNVTDPRLVTKREFVGTIAEGVGLKPPSRSVPLPVAKVVARVLESVWRWRKKDTPPILSQARIKFLGLNLDFSSERARRRLGYDPQHDFADAMATTMQAFSSDDRS